MGINQQLALIASFSLALMLSVLSYLTVSVHFVLAWNQYHHDGDNLFFVPFTLLVFVTAAIAALGYLGLRKHGKSVFVALFFLVSCFSWRSTNSPCSGPRCLFYHCFLAA